MSDSSTTAAKASGVTPTTAVPEGVSESSSALKSNLPASNSDPLPESPAYTPSDSIYPPPAEPESRPAAPTSTTNNLTESIMPAPTTRDTLASLDDETIPTKTISTTVNLTDPPAPQPGAIPTPTSFSTSQDSNTPSGPQPGATATLPSETSTAVPAPTSTSIPAPTFTMPPVQTTYGPPEVTMRGQPIPGYTSTASTTSYNNFPSAIRRTSEVAPMPGGYQQRANSDNYVPPSEEPPREDGILGKVSKAVDKFNEWMVGENK